MEAIRLLSYRNWSISIHCECVEIAGEPARFVANALLTELRDQALSPSMKLFQPPTVVQLSDVSFQTSQAANEAVLSESRRHIDAFYCTASTH